MLEGVRFVIRWWYSKVIIESDCFQLIQALKSPFIGASDFHLVVENILSLSSCLDDVMWSFVKSSGNKIAHVFAHLQSWEIGHCCWVHDIPEKIVHVVSLDLLN